jgi:surfactin synthase thioesterase subunit
MDDWLITTRGPGAPRVRLVCFPFAGAGASLFRSWSADVPAGVELCRVQLPGRENRSRERPFTRMQDVIEALLPALREGPPVALFGHSLGGLIAFELAAALQQVAAPLAWLFVSGARPPHVPDPYQLHRLSEAAFANALRDRGGIPEDVLTHPELRELVLPLLRADLELAETFVRGEPLALPIPITVCAAPADAVIPWAVTAAWQAYTTGAFERRAFEGDHFFVRTCPDAVRRCVWERLVRQPDV